MSFSILLLLGIAFLLFWFWNRNHEKSKLTTAHNRTAASEVVADGSDAKYRCVVIEPGWDSCQSVRQYEAKYMLLDEAPALPVEKCDNNACQCEFVHYDDRRREDRRSVETDSQFVNQGNKRKGKGRRQSDCT